MLVSVFTPSHDTRFLGDCHQSLVEQTYGDWACEGVLNGGARDWQPSSPDERVRVVRESASGGVGAVKRSACALARGEVLVELDHDDLLTRTCLAEVVGAFEVHPEATLVYSDCTQINEDRTPNLARFNQGMGWVYSDERIGSKTYLRCHSMAPYPHNVAYIWYAPNHVRAFRRSAYEAVGGYDAQLKVLDDQELMIRLFLAGEFVHIDRCLYLQRVHPKNTQIEPATNAFIQEQTVRYYQQHIEALATAWAGRNGLEVLTLRTPTSPEPADDESGRIVVVEADSPGLRCPQEGVGVIRASELLQRVPDRAALFNSCWDALAHGGLLLTETPSTDGRGAFQDPSHVAFYNENSFWYVTQARYRASLPELRARFMVSHIRTHFPTQWHEQTNISYVQANLIALKQGPRQGGPLLW
jgi:glycosyltransferase involved in cell wall biosynthesis